MREMKDSGIEWIGEIPAEWDIARMKSCIIQRDSGAWGEEATGGEGDAVCLRIADFDYGAFKFKGTPVEELTHRHYAESVIKKLRLQKNDILIEKSGGGEKTPVGRTVIFDKPYIALFANFMDRLKCANFITPAFMQYVFVTFYKNNYTRNYIKQTTGIQNLDLTTMLASESVPLPTILEQKKITCFLDCTCAEIDAVIERTKATIEEYTKLRQAIITDAVTKGVRVKRTMKNSGNIWYGDIPVDWDIRKLKYMFRIKKDIAGREGYTVLSITQRGILPKNIASNEGQLAENYSNYQLVEPGDFAMNHMDLLTGWVDISQYSGVTSPDYRVFNLLDPKYNCSKYYLYLMQMCYTNRIFYGLGQGVSGMGRWRLQADKFLNFTIPVPPCEEQFEIAEYLDKRCAEMDTLIAKKTALLAELEAYKKSVIYEYVTGKKEVGVAEQSVTIIYPYFPAVLGTNKTRFAQAVLMSRILDKCRMKMGRVKLEKILYTIETSIGFDFDTEYVRQAAGPLDESIYECEAIISRRNKWYTMKTSKYGVSYTPAKDNGKYKQYYDKYFADYDSEIERIIGIFMDYDADQAEIVATLFAAWNDFIIDRKEFNDEQLADEVLNNWNDSKKRFSKDAWLRAIEQMRQNNIIPKGYGKRTVIKN